MALPKKGNISSVFECMVQENDRLLKHCQILQKYNLIGFYNNKVPVVTLIEDDEKPALNGSKVNRTSSRVPTKGNFIKRKQVIIKTNVESGTKCLVVQQNAGNSIEIPAKLATVNSKINALSCKSTTDIPNVVRHMPNILQRSKLVKPTSNKRSLQNQKFKTAMNSTSNCTENAKVLSMNYLSSKSEGVVVKVPEQNSSTTQTQPDTRQRLEDKQEDVNVIKSTDSSTLISPLSVASVTINSPDSQENVKQITNNTVTPVNNLLTNTKTYLHKKKILFNNNPNENSVQSTNKLDFLKHKSSQTVNSTVSTKDATIQTDDELLEELIQKRILEQSKKSVSKAVNTDPMLYSDLPLFETDNDILKIIEDDLNSIPINDNSMNFIELPITQCATNNAHISTSNLGLSKINMPNLSAVDSWKVDIFYDLKKCNQCDAAGNFPIHTAVISNNITMVRRQILFYKAVNVDINIENSDLHTALQLAMLYDVNLNIIQLLLQNGADVGRIDNDGNNLLHTCIMNSRNDVMQALLTNINASVDINLSNFDGYTPLITCVLNNKLYMAEALLIAGANPNVCDKKSGRTALFHAIEANDVAMVKLLLNYDASTRTKNFFGITPHEALFELDFIDASIKTMMLKEHGLKGRSDMPLTPQRGKRNVSQDTDEQSVPKRGRPRSVASL